MLKKILFAVFCAIVLSGCYYTIEPIYTEKDIVTDDAIVGNWGRKESNEKWSFMKDEYKRTYSSEYIENNGRTASPFNVTLVKIGKYKYLDMFADSKNVENQNSTFKSMLLGCHNYIRYTVENDKLIFVNYNLNWLEKKLSNKELDLHYFKREGGYFFSDSTENLQKAIISLEDKKEAFNDETYILERIK